MKEETFRQKQIFDIYYSLKDRSLQKLKNKLDELSVKDGEKSVSLKTLERWSKKFNWQERIQQRDIELSKDLTKKINEDIVDEKAKHRKLIKDILDELKRTLEDYQNKIKTPNNNPVQIKNIRDLKELSTMIDTLIKLDMSLIGEGLEKINIIISEEILPNGYKSDE